MVDEASRLALRFRRQFILGKEPFLPGKHWSKVEFGHGLHLSVHEDLPVASASTDERAVSLLGLAIHPFHPRWSESDIVQYLLSTASDMTALLESAKPLSGRWVLIFQLGNKTVVLTDPCGYRTVYYYTGDTDIRCASQPALLHAQAPMPPNENEELQAFLRWSVFAKTEFAFVGNRTIYQDCFHLMPNFYLDLSSGRPVRFFGTGPLPQKEPTEAAAMAASILRGTMEGVAFRGNAVVPLTAGWDSRVLLAASRDWTDRLSFFVDGKGRLPAHHPDIRVPRLLARRLKLDFEVRQSANEPAGWFCRQLGENVTGARLLPKTQMIWDKFRRGDDRTNINGNGSEICRTKLDPKRTYDSDGIPTEVLAELFGYPGAPAFVIRELEAWRDTLPRPIPQGLHILDLLLWEQKQGNWGAMYPAEQDLACDEISPYNCRLLIETLLSTSRRMRGAPDYPIYRKTIRRLWPKTMRFPINPPFTSAPRRKSLRRRIGKILSRVASGQ